MDFSKEEIFDNDVFRSLPLNKRLSVANAYADEIGIFDNDVFNNLQKETGQHELSYSDPQVMGFEDSGMTPQGQTAMMPVMVEDVEKKTMIRDSFLTQVVQPRDEELLEVSRFADTTFKVAGDIAGSISGDQGQIDRGFSRDYIGRRIKEINTGDFDLIAKDPQAQNFEDVQQTPQGQVELSANKHTDMGYDVGQYYPHVALGFATGGVGGVQGASLDIAVQGITSYLAHKNEYGGEKETTIDVAIDFTANAIGLGIAKYLKYNQLNKASQAMFKKPHNKLDAEEKEILSNLQEGVKDVDDVILEDVQKKAQTMTQEKKSSIDEATEMFDDMVDPKPQPKPDKTFAMMEGTVEKPTLKPNADDIDDATWLGKRDIEGDDFVFVDPITKKEISAKVIRENEERIVVQYFDPYSQSISNKVFNKETGEAESAINPSHKVLASKTYEQGRMKPAKAVVETPTPKVEDINVPTGKNAKVLTGSETVGAMAGFEEDENGNWTYNVEKGLLGAVGAKLTHKTLTNKQVQAVLKKELKGQGEKMWNKYIESNYSPLKFAVENGKSVAKQGDDFVTELKTVSLKDLEGESIIPIIADRTRAGGHYTGVDSAKTDPVEMMGGGLYPALKSSKDGGVVWASRNNGEITGWRKKAKASGKDYIYGIVTQMKHDAHKSNSSVGEAVLNTFEAYEKNGRLPVETQDAITEAIIGKAKSLLKGKSQAKKKVGKAFAQMPHFRKTKEVIKHIDSLTFEARAELAKLLQTSSIQGLEGVPSVNKILRETTEPMFGSQKMGHGQVIVKLYPNQPVKLGEGGTKIHPSYTLGIKGELVGKLGRPLQHDQIFPDYINAKKKAGAKDAQAWRAFTLSKPAQVLRKDIVDTVVDSEFKYIKSPRQAILIDNASKGRWKTSDRKKGDGGVSSTEFVKALDDSMAVSTLSKPDASGIDKVSKAGIKRTLLQREKMQLDKDIKSGNTKVYQLEDGDVYFTTSKNADYNAWFKDEGFHSDELTGKEISLGSVVNNEQFSPKVGSMVVAKAIEEGVEVLDAFAVKTKSGKEVLPSFYEKFGFEEIGRIGYNKEYSTPQLDADRMHYWKSQGWDEKSGMPDIVIMKWRGTDAERKDFTKRLLEGSDDLLKQGSTEVEHFGAKGLGDDATAPNKRSVSRESRGDDRVGEESRSRRTGDVRSVYDEINGLSKQERKSLGLREGFATTELIKTGIGAGVGAGVGANQSEDKLVGALVGGMVGGALGAGGLKLLAETVPLAILDGVDVSVRAIQKGMFKGKTIDQAIGKWLKTESDHKVVDAIKKAVVQDYRLSDQYLALADNANIAVKRGENEATKIFEKLKVLDEDELAQLHNYVAGESDEIATHLQALANSAKRAIKAKTQELVHLGLLPEDILEVYKKGYLHREYEKHIGKAISDTFFNQQKKLSAQYKRGKEILVTKEEFNDLVSLGEVGDNIRDAKYVRDGEKNGKVVVRRDWTPSERAEMGEIVNASYTVPSTIMKLQRDIAYGKFLAEVATDPMLSGSIKTAEDMKSIAGVGRISDIPTSGTGFQQLTGSKYGKLDGLYVADAMANDIKGFKQSLYGDEKAVMEAWKSLLTEWKVAKTVKNPTAHMNNFTSNMVMSYYAGIPPSQIGRNTINAMVAIKNKSGYYLEAEEIGLLGRSKLEEIRRVVDKPVAQSRTWMQKMARNIYMSEDSKMGNFAFKMYSLEDDISRLALYTHYREAGKTPAQAMKKSGEVVFDYSKRMPPMLRGMRDSGLVPFVSWTYKAIPLMFSTMFQRPSRYASIVGAYVLLDNMINKDAEKPEFMRGKYMTVSSDNRESTQVRTASMTPFFDWITEPAGTGKQFGLGGIPQKFIEGLAGRQFWNDQKISYRQGTEKAIDYGLWTFNSIMPSPAYLTKAYNIGEAVAHGGQQPKRNKLFKPRTVGQATAGMFGINVRTYNKTEQKKRDIEKQRKELKKK